MSTFNPLHLLSLPPLSVDAKPLPTSLAFDPFSDLLWVGSSSGHLTALCSPLSLARNVQFPAHGASTAGTFLSPGSSPAVREIQVNDREVWSLTEGGIGGRRRGGAPRWSVADSLRGMRSMCQNPLNSHEVVAGGMGQIILANTAKGELVRRYDSRGSIVKIAPVQSQRLVLCASAGGQLGMLDPRTGFKPAFKTDQVTSHSGGLSGADVQGTIVCTWGWTHHSGHPFPDPNVKLYDVRTLKALPPVSFPLGPAFCVLDPSSSSRLLVASQQGSLQMVDLSSGVQGEHQQLDVSSYLTAMTWSPRGDYLAFGDADGQLHLWTTHDTGDGAATREDGNLALPPFNGYDGVKPDWPDPVVPPPAIQWDDTTPLNLIGMPYYNTPLLSNFPSSDYAPASSPFFNPAPPIPKSVLDTMRMVDFVGRAKLPSELKGKRNVVTAKPGAAKYATSKGFVMQRKESGPKFRSEQERRRKSQELLSRTGGMVEEEDVDGEVPRRYRRVEIKYSRFGVEDFDFAFYNHTEHSGLETHIINSYTNPLLQTLHYSAPIRAIAKAHICVDCQKEHCLLCEAGFLFRMLEDAQGTNCQASNFSRAFSATPQAAALGLIDETNGNAPSYTGMIQYLNRWLLSTFSAEAIVEGVENIRVKRRVLSDLDLSDKDQETLVDQILGLPMRTTNTCSNCGHTTQRETTLHTVDLIYPKDSAPGTAFAEILQNGMVRETTTRATCVNCKIFSPLHSRRQLAKGGSGSLPSVLSINTMATTAEQRLVWQDQLVNKEIQYFLPPEIEIAAAVDGSVHISSGTGEVEEGARYELRSVLCQIQSSVDHPPHLVSFVRMPPTSEGDGNDAGDEPIWILFNDFLVRPVTQAEVLSFSALWKTPAIVVYERQDMGSVLDLSQLPSRLDYNILLHDVSTAWNRKKNMIKHKVLNVDELPDRESIVSIDAEFVELQREETEFKSDGTKKVIRPSQMSLARVSVLRGEGVEEAKPFIDDYIHTSELVVDYLTEYSGIKNGDLDPNNSPHTLVPLKVAYKKLRLLVDLGCSFVGHGLAKDFRTINIFVPPSQIKDTVNLFALPGRSRKLSLRFLVWYLLREDIQTGMHDSIEDARCAWLLYKLWKRLQEEGRFDEVMQDVSDEGAKLGYKPPNDRVPSPAPPQQTSMPPGISPAPSPGPHGPQLGPMLNVPPSHSPSAPPNWRRPEGRGGPAPTPLGNGRNRGRRHH